MTLSKRLLAAFPDLLAGDQIDAEVPRRFMLVAREQGIASEEGAGEVVGQMLEYAANAVLHWPVDELRARFAERCASEGAEPDLVLGRLIGAEGDPTRGSSRMKPGRMRVTPPAQRRSSAGWNMPS